MGVWEEALREAAAQRYAEVQSLQRQREQAAEQVQSVADFVEHMRRSGIRPQRQPFLVVKESATGNRYRASRLHKIIGWDIGAGAVVTPDGSVYDMTNQEKEPSDLRRLQAFSLTGDSPQSLTELLRQALEGATKDR